MSNINRDYLIVLNPKTSKVTVPELNYYIYDKYTANLFVNLVTVENGKVVNMVDADQYKLVLHVLKPTNEIQTVENIQVFNKEKALFQIELDAELTKNIGRYKCELLTIDKTDHIVQSAKFSYRVKKSIYNDLDVVTETPQYPIIITLLDKLQDIDKYEEERRANEVARVAAEKARVKDYTDLRKTVTTDIDTMQQKIDSFDGKVQEVDNAVTQMRTNITDYQTKKNTELDNYKTQKDTQINTAIKGMETTIDKYKTAKDTEINAKITQQDTKIDSAINLQNKNIQASTKALNDKLDVAVQDQNNTIATNNQAQNKVINDAITEQNKTINNVVENDKVQNERLDTLERNDDTFANVLNSLIDKDTAHEERMAAIEAVDVEQNNRLDAIEIKNDQQDGRLNDVEAKNKKQDMDLKCLFAESHSERITIENEVGNSVFLQNSKQGFATVDELKGNTLVNCNKDTDKELILNGNIDTSGYSNVTITEGVDGGKVDVSLQGNTMVNVCDQEDPVAITKSYTVETGNHIALQGEYDGKCRPNIYGNTLVNIADSFTCRYACTYENNILTTTQLTKGAVHTGFENTTTIKRNTIYTAILQPLEIPDGVKQIVLFGTKEFGDVKYITNPVVNQVYCISATSKSDDDINIYYFSVRPDTATTYTSELKCKFMLLEGDYTNKPIPDYFTGMKSSFEDKLIADEKDANHGKYKVDYKVTGKNLLDESKGVMNSSMGSKTICIKVRPNTSYTYSSSVYKGSIAIYELASIVDNDTDVSNLQNVAIKNLGLTDEDSFTVSGSTNYIFMNYDGESKVQIEEGAKATTYEPYKEYTKTVYLNSPLLEGDTIEQSGNDIVHVHKYNSVTFDGSDDENWVYWGNNTDNGKLDSSLISFYLPFTNYKDFTTSTIFNNKFLMGNTVWGAKTEMMALNADNIMSFQVALLRSKLATQDVAGFKTWLQQNPITIAYELATPTQEIISTNDNLLLDSCVNGHLDMNSAVPIDKVVFQSYGTSLKYLSPNTEYTIQFESDSNGKLDALALNSSDVIGNLNIVKGINKFTISTSDTITVSYLWTNGIGFNMSKIVVTPKVEQPFGYFKGMKSVGECEGNKIEVVAQNKNLFTSEVIDALCTLENWIGNGAYKSNYVAYKLMNFKDGTTYTNTIPEIKVPPHFYPILFLEDVSNGSFIPSGWYQNDTDNEKNVLGNTYTFTPQSEGHFRAYVYSWNEENMQKLRKVLEQNIQTEIGKTSTGFVAAKHNKQTLTHEPLRGLPNGARDKYVIIDGKWYIERNCGVDNQLQIRNWLRYDLDGKYPNVVGFYMNKDDMKIISALQCDKFKCLNTDAFPGKLTRNDEFLCGVERNIPYFKISIYRNKLETLDTNGFKKWLSENNVTIVYPLKTPTYEPIDYNPFEVYSDTTHISNNSNIPCNMVVRNSGYNCILKPNTTYTVSSNNGLSTVSTKDSIGDGILRFYDKDTTSITKMSNVLVLEGDYVTGNPPIPAFFKGMESAFEQELVTDEKDEHYGKYKVNVKATNPDNSQQNNITFYLKEPLRGVGNVKDKVYVKEDKVVVQRNCVNYVIEPTQIPSWAPISKGIYTYNISVNNPIVNTAYGEVVCNSLPCDVNNAHKRNYANTISTVVDQSVPNGVIRIITDKDPETLKQWLQANPTTVVYQLATPTYEEVEYFDLKLFVEIFKDTTINYNSNIPVTSTINYTFSVPIVEQVNTLSKDVTAVQESANTVMTLASIMEDEVNK